MIGNKDTGTNGLKGMEDWVMANLDPHANGKEMRKQSAEELKNLYDSFVAAGFTPKQSMELLMTLVSSLVAGVKKR